MSLYVVQKKLEQKIYAVTRTEETKMSNCFFDPVVFEVAGFLMCTPTTLAMLKVLHFIIFFYIAYYLNMNALVIVIITTFNFLFYFMISV